MKMFRILLLASTLGFVGCEGSSLPTAADASAGTWLDEAPEDVVEPEPTDSLSALSAPRDPTIGTDN